MIFKNIFVYPRYPENLQKLYDLACNLWCTWNYSAIGLFYRIDTKLFREVNHNPLMFLSSLSKQKLKDLSEDKGFLYELDNIWEKFQHYLEYDRKCADECNEICGYNKDDVIAYFSMEFGLHESIPIYAGGLGILAGDYLKGASDMDLPIVGIGLLYKYGYFTQKIDRYGHQQEVFSTFENHLIPIRELHAPDGGLAYIDVMLLDEPVKVKLWKIDVGKVELILLDTDIEENKPHLRDITNELYVGDREKRLQQELLLGIGGIKALDYLEIKTRIYHFNEGHSAFAILGRLEQLVKKDKFTLSQAIAIIRASTVFTTHTPVIAGNENFDTKLIKKYLTPKLEKIGLKFDDIAKYGFIGEDSDRFWLPAFAMNFSKYINGVSVQHAQISKHLWSGLFPQMPSVEIPIHALTNGVHNCWVSPPFTDLFTRYLGPDYIHVARREEVWKNIYNIPDEELWDEHRRNKKDLVNFIRRQFVDQMIARGFSHAKMVNVNKSLNAEFMTIVFARRFAAYKRPTLILNDKERLVRILTDTNKPVQMIFAGKAHPADDYSKNMIKEILDFAREYNVEDRVIFLENYDINIARHLFWGSDIWLNNPKPDMEASGTSGMKAAMNGVLHVSTAEGWWLEGYDGKNGWIINAGRIYSNSEQQDIADANQLYDLLEYQIIEFYYDRDDSDIPKIWVRMMKDAVFSVCQNFSINRLLCDYFKTAYAPANRESNKLAENNYSVLKEASTLEDEIIKVWDAIRVVSFSTNIEKCDHIMESEELEVECGIDYSGANAELFSVELFYIYKDSSSYKILPMEFSHLSEGVRYYKYRLKIKGCGSQNINVRIRPSNPIVSDIHPEMIKWKD